MNPTPQPIIKELGAGLILRRSSPGDAEALSAFCGEIHSDYPDRPDPQVAAWTRDLLTRPHPTFHSDDFTIVQEAETGRILSTLNLISQTWTYDGIPFGVGRPELVGTLPEYRNRGLVRLQFEEIHRWSAERGELVQAITGIPYYYRLFGYEMAIDLDGMRSGFETHVPFLREGEQEAYRFRPAAEGDLPLIAALYHEGCQRYPIACVREEAAWRYELTGRDPVVTQVMLVIERSDGEPVGILRHLPTLNWPDLGGRQAIIATLYELKRGVSWLDVTPAVIRRLWATGQEYAATDDTACKSFSLAFGEMHPAYEAARECLPQIRRSYAWYVRVEDLPRFLLHVASALERRLAGSIACGYTGRKLLSFYRSGFCLIFEKGRLAGIEPWKPAHRDEGDIAFPNLTFLQLLFGYRSLEELAGAFPDCRWESNETRVLFDALFPRRPSQVVAIS